MNPAADDLVLTSLAFNWAAAAVKLLSADESADEIITAIDSVISATADSYKKLARLYKAVVEGTKAFG